MIGGLIEIFDEQSQAAAGEAEADRLMRHMLAHAFCQGRHTITGLLSAAGRQAQDWSADYRLYTSELDTVRLFEPIVRGVMQLLGPDQPLVLAVDDSILRKTGKKVDGVGWYRDPLGPAFHTNLAFALKFVQISAAIPDPNNPKRARMIPVAVAIAPKLPKPPKDADKQELKAYEKAKQQNSPSNHAIALLTTLCEQIHNHDKHRRRPIWLAGDGHYTTTTVLQNLPDGVVYMGRCRKDLNLHALPSPSKRRGPGRPLAYGDRLPTPEQLRQDKQIEWKTISIEYAGAKIDIRIKHIQQAKWEKAGEKNVIQVIVIAPLRYRKTKYGPWRYTKPAYIICSDASLPPEQVVQAYFWRWDIEVNFRDEKQLFGASQAQVRNPASVTAAPSVAIAAYAGLVLAALRTFGFTNVPPAVQLPKWRQAKPPRRLTTQDLLYQLRHEAAARLINLDRFMPSHAQTRST